MNPTTFPHVSMHNNGFRWVIPIHRSAKNPALGPGWTGHGPMTQAEALDWQSKGYGIGIPGKAGINIDADLHDRETAEHALKRLCFYAQARVLVRVGRAPTWGAFFKYPSTVQLPLDTADRHRYLPRSSSWMPADPKDRVWNLDYRGPGQQMVLAGIHPDTGNPYRLWWVKHNAITDKLEYASVSPEDIAYGDIPSATLTVLQTWHDDVAAYIDANKVGALVRARGNSRHMPWALGIHDDPECRDGIERVRAVVARIKNDTRDYNWWRDVGLAIRAALPEDPVAAFQIWDAWSATNKLVDPFTGVETSCYQLRNDTRVMWDTLGIHDGDPNYHGKIGMGSLYHWAGASREDFDADPSQRLAEAQDQLPAVAGAQPLDALPPDAVLEIEEPEPAPENTVDPFAPPPPSPPPPVSSSSADPRANAGGIIAVLVDHIMAGATFPHLGLAFAAAVKAVEYPAHPVIIDDGEGRRLNTASIMVAGSSHGKNWPLKYLMAAIRAYAQLHPLLHGKIHTLSDTASAQGLHDALSDCSALMLAVDEIDQWIVEISDSKAQHANRQTGALFRQLMTGSLGTLPAKAYARGNAKTATANFRPAIPYPYFCVFGTCTHVALRAALDATSVHVGDFNRWEFHEGEAVLPLRNQTPASPQAVAPEYVYWCYRLLEHLHGAGTVPRTRWPSELPEPPGLASTSVAPDMPPIGAPEAPEGASGTSGASNGPTNLNPSHHLPLTPQAVAYAQRWNRDYDEQRRQLEGAGDDAGATAIGREGEVLTTYAGKHALSRDPTTGAVDVGDYEWADEVVRVLSRARRALVSKITVGASIDARLRAAIVEILGEEKYPADLTGTTRIRARARWAVDNTGVWSHTDIVKMLHKRGIPCAKRDVEEAFEALEQTNKIGVLRGMHSDIALMAARRQRDKKRAFTTLTSDGAKVLRDFMEKEKGSGVEPVAGRRAEYVWLVG